MSRSSMCWNGNYDYVDARACHTPSCPKLGAARLRDLRPSYYMHSTKWMYQEILCGVV